MTPDWKSFVPWILTLATLSVGIWQYADKSAQASREPFLKEQMRYVFETSEVVARLAAGADPVQWDKDRNRFWTIYYGPLAIVEDTDVEAQMVAIGKIVPRPGTAQPPLPFAVLANPALKLDIALRGLMLKAWGMDLTHVGMREVTR